MVQVTDKVIVLQGKTGDKVAIEKYLRPELKSGDRVRFEKTLGKLGATIPAGANDEPEGAEQ